MKQIFAAVIADAINRLSKYDIKVLDDEQEKKIKEMITADTTLPEEPENV